jgi:hypothetical protein
MTIHRSLADPNGLTPLPADPARSASTWPSGPTKARPPAPLTPATPDAANPPLGLAASLRWRLLDTLRSVNASPAERRWTQMTAVRVRRSVRSTKY